MRFNTLYPLTVRHTFGGHSQNKLILDWKAGLTSFMSWVREVEPK
jgi:hypothetical protein